MKKLLFLIATCTPFSLFAQSPVNLGGKIGMNVSYLSTGIDQYNADNFLGFTGGGFLRINIKKFHIQPELLYAQRGGNIAFLGNNIVGNPNFEIRTHHMQIPLLVGYRPLDIPFFKLRVEGGPYASHVFGRDIKESGGNNNFEKQKMSQWSAGLIAGVGLDVWNFTLDLRHHWGLVNMLGDNTFSQDPNAQFKNGTWEISIGFKIF
jgi:hypothetical protein